MRTLSLPSTKLELDVTGRVGQNSLCLVDLDGDGGVELAVGTRGGVLYVFKGNRIWKKCSGLGQISAVAAGDLANKGHDVLLTISSDGWCHVFDFVTKTDVDPLKVDEECEQKDGLGEWDGRDEEENDQEEGRDNLVRPFARQRLLANIKEAMILDVNNDGANELCVALTDRVVRTYKWRSERGAHAHLQACNKWEFGEQVGSVTLIREEDGSNVLIVAQPGGALLKVSQSGGSEEMLAYQDPQVRGSNAEIQGCLESKSSGPPPYAICTMDGTLTMARQGKVIWSRQTYRQLFCLHKLDVDGDGCDEIVVSSWTGHTYIASQTGRISEFIFDERVCTFTCGLYTFRTETKPVLVYVTIQGKIHIYYDFKIISEDIPVLNIDPHEEITDLLLEEGISLRSPRDLKEFNAFWLYSAL